MPLKLRDLPGAQVSCNRQSRSTIRAVHGHESLPHVIDAIRNAKPMWVLYWRRFRAQRTSRLPFLTSAIRWQWRQSYFSDHLLSIHLRFAWKVQISDIQAGFILLSHDRPHSLLYFLTASYYQSNYAMSLLRCSFSPFTIAACSFIGEDQAGMLLLCAFRTNIFRPMFVFSYLVHAPFSDLHIQFMICRCSRCRPHLH